MSRTNAEHIKYRGDKSCKDARQYIAECLASEKVKLPTTEGLAMRFNVVRDTLANWAKAYPEFAHVMHDLKATQKEMLLNNGLGGKYNPAIAKLVLSHNHGMRENSDVTTGGKPIEAPPPVIVMFGSNDDTE